MSLYRDQKKPQSAWQDLAIFVGVLAFLAYSIHAFQGMRRTALASAPPKESISQPTPIRQPASEAEPGAGSTEILNMPCFQPVMKFASKARLVQIQANLCSPVRSGANWQASNITSGDEILVFVNEKEKLLSTSYFNLRPGLNEISFRENGKRIPSAAAAKIEINRSSSD